MAPSLSEQSGFAYGPGERWFEGEQAAGLWVTLTSARLCWVIRMTCPPPGTQVLSKCSTPRLPAGRAEVSAHEWDLGPDRSDSAV